jgi:hypothetical protein
MVIWDMMIGQEYWKIWIVIQHADNDIKFKRKMLKALK